MINLTPFALAHIPSGITSIGQLLDFFEGAPHLREVRPHCSATPTPGGQNGRLASLVCSKKMEINGVNLLPSCSITC